MKVACCIYIALPWQCGHFAFDWDDDNVAHIERHEFTPEEVEEVFAGGFKSGNAAELYVALGETLDGRLAFVVFRRLRGA